MAATIADDLIEEVVARLRAYSPAIVADTESIRADHRTRVAADECPRIHVIPGTETPKGGGRGCRVDVTFGFRVVIFVRDDAGYAAAALLKVPVMAALDSTSAAYGHKARLTPGRIVSDQEIADADSLSVEMEFEFRFERTDWRLDDA